MWRPSGMSEPTRVKTVNPHLTDDERRMLVHGSKDWAGPAHGTDYLTVAMGLVSLDDLHKDSDRIAIAIAYDEPLPVRDWTRAIVATEIVRASDVLGTGASSGPSSKLAPIPTGSVYCGVAAACVRLHGCAGAAPSPGSSTR